MSLADHPAAGKPERYPMDFFQFWIDDWTGGVKKLSLDEEAAYLRVCIAIYHEGQPVDDDDATMARECRVSTRKWRTLKAGLIALEKITVRDGKIHQGKCAVVIDRARRAAEKQRDSGRIGGRKSADERRKTLKQATSDQGRLKQASSNLSTYIQNTSYSGTEAPCAAPSEERKEDVTPPLPASDLPVPAPTSRVETVWSDKPGGVIWQLTQMGAGRQSAGGMIATWRKKHEDDVIVQAVALTWADHGRTFVADPRSRVLFHLNRLSGRSGGKPEFNPHLI